jgi:diguanylate cyclase (GGDEF)-like protein
LEELLHLETNCPLADRECPYGTEIRRLKEECQRLQELSRIDSLTGFFNFRYLLEALESEMERTRRTSLPTGLIMIDLDHFKRINDKYGHDSGNKALQWCSKLWRNNIRRIDIPCRYGGEEFVIILPGTPLTKAVHTAQRLRAILSRSTLVLGGDDLTLTASFGVDAYRGIADLSPEVFLKRADKHLLKSKANGRNCVSFEKSRLAPEKTELTPEEREALVAGRRPVRG